MVSWRGTGEFVAHYDHRVIVEWTIFPTELAIQASITRFSPVRTFSYCECDAATPNLIASSRHEVVREGPHGP